MAPDSVVAASTAPFKEPVNPSEVPNYYNVVKVPMGKYTPLTIYNGKDM